MRSHLPFRLFPRDRREAPAVAAGAAVADLTMMVPLCIARIGDGAIREEDLARAKFLIFDAPIAILRPHLLAESAIPPFAGQMIAELHAGVPFASADVRAGTTQAA